eukprot:RCo037232
MYERDGDYVTSALQQVMDLANAGQGVDFGESPRTLQRQAALQVLKSAGAIPKADLRFLLNCMMSRYGDGIIRCVCPLLTEQMLQTLTSLLASAMLVVSRRSHALRCLAAAESLLSVLRGLASQATTTTDAESPVTSPVSCADILAQVSELVRAVACTRHIFVPVTEKGGGGGHPTAFTYDPRLLVFEFVNNVILRKGQVDLVRRLTSSVKKHSSICTQMLMGEGKSTVVTPLLGLLLADRLQLVMLCVPHALLDFSRQALRDRFLPLHNRPVL